MEALARWAQTYPSVTTMRDCVITVGWRSEYCHVDPTSHLFLALKMESGAAGGILLIDAVAPAIRTSDHRLKPITVVGIEGWRLL